MQNVTFYIATFLALIYVAVLFGKAHENQALEEAMTTQRNYQIKLLQAQQINQYTHQLVQRIAAESPTDPALASLLKGNGVQVTINSSSDNPTPNTASTTTAQKNPVDTPINSAP